MTDEHSWYCSKCGSKGATFKSPTLDPRYGRGHCETCQSSAILIRSDAFDRARWLRQKEEKEAPKPKINMITKK